MSAYFGVIKTGGKYVDALKGIAVVVAEGTDLKNNEFWNSLGSVTQGFNFKLVLN